MQKLSLKNLISFIIHKPSRLIELMRKAIKRLFENKNSISIPEYKEWLKTNLIDFTSFANNLDPALWNESVKFSLQLKESAIIKLKDIPYDLGGGGIYPILYFITRKLKPQIIVETGVAAGYSSQTFLSAIRVNGIGKLYSSDFPYFRIPEPEKYIGIMVDDNLKANWKLFLDGDKTNLPKITNEVDSISLFHYDSDKSYSGRTFAVDTIKSKLAPDSILMFDDIDDNTHFYDYVKKENVTDYHIFWFESKHIGLIGKI